MEREARRSIGPLNDADTKDMAMFEPNHKVLNTFVNWIESPQFDVQHAKRMPPHHELAVATN